MMELKKAVLPSDGKSTVEDDGFGIQHDEGATLTEAVHLTPMENLAAGAFGGALETCLQMPILTYKFCLQEGRQLPSTLGGWYRGVGVQAGTVAPITALQFMANGLLQRLVLGSYVSTAAASPLTDTQRIGTAAGAGFISAVLYSPVDLLTIQQQRLQLSLVGTIGSITQMYGMAGLYRGFLTCASREAIYTAGYLGLAPVVTHRLIRATNQSIDPLLAKVCGACLAGTAAALVTHPIDTVKTVLQSDMDRHRWKTARQSFGKLLEQGGVASLYRGVVPRTVRLCGAFFVCVMVQDAAMQWKTDRVGG
mmetsp:Transcript_1628/g.4460  ORF Transcript_1628/g.4460 Transcript_1628/m.4460 type:complete len:308 (-) Transcript_1628:80-1003(-)|eukprot:CAMPEP_0198126868 /NCGR_PEP_ID=MMETSP1442-20131203/45956_1 /TAXON_ID= /ORGANISM="Craspedostauros australis, Strain CCMP3328" /LENGTH=307 /DNA_ID=CAMNT_0043786761 /DNA_START=351 /DNA_END=1274 /DNA_ORIENTATION=-